MPKKVIIMGAAGRDFHVFNTIFRDNKKYKVVAFTAAQIPNISERKYPKELAGKLYPKGIDIHDEKDLPKLIKKIKINEVIFAYSDISYKELMNKASLVLSSGADFKLLSPDSTMLKSKKPVISICAVRTGCGKSQTTRKICRILKRKKIKFVVIRHPMPYGDLRKQVWQRFNNFRDLDKHKCTIEEREEYEPHIEEGNVVYAGVDYKEILKRAEKEADVIVWDGGNNDFPFYKTDLHIVLADPLRPKHELTYYPSVVNLRMADVVIINKENNSTKKSIKIIKDNIRKINKKVLIIDANSKITIEKPNLLKNKKVLVLEDGPTLTHGGMSYGAGYIAAKKCKIIDPRPYATGSIKEIYKKYKIGKVLPAMGYSKKQRDELQKTINEAKCDLIIIGTPIDLRRFLKINKPAVRVRYELEEIGKPDLNTVIKKFLKN